MERDNAAKDFSAKYQEGTKRLWEIHEHICAMLVGSGEPDSIRTLTEALINIRKSLGIQR